MYKKDDLVSLIKSAKAVESTLIPKSMNTSDRNRLITTHASIAKKSSIVDVLLIIARI